ncbi:MAG TPA: DUF2269 family protein [Thermoleophilaceae bacterium]|jgi:uncharacterized membrane protein
MPAAASAYDVSVAIHVAAAVVGFGPTFAYPFIQLAAERGDPDRLPFALGVVLAISSRLAVPGALVVGATGVYQVADGPHDLGEAWLAVGAVLYAAVFVAAVAFLAPALRRARAAAERGDRAGYRRAIAGAKAVGAGVAAAVLAIVFLMELKPG